MKTLTLKDRELWLRLLVAALSFAGMIWAASAQDGGGGKAADPAQTAQEQARRDAQTRARQEARDRLDETIRRAEQEGVSARIKDVARFRGVRPNQLVGTGLVIGLAGNGDSSRSAVTRNLMANLLKDFGQILTPDDLNSKNIAAVFITAELPPFSTNGQAIDVNVQSMGDAKSLVGGTLLQTALYAAGDRNTVYAMAQGQVTVGGYDATGSGGGQKKNHATAGRISEGALVERGAPTKLSFDGKMYLELQEPDLTTAQRLEDRLRTALPQFGARAINGGTIELTLPAGTSEVQAMAMIEPLEVMVDTPATIVINEKTGTIVIGGNVRVAPAAIVHGNLNVQIDYEILVSQPGAFTNGDTVVADLKNTTVTEDKPKIVATPPITTVADLVRIFKALDLKASDIISILQTLRQQGALKARVISQ